MKDAKGHGSAAHQAGTAKIGKQASMSRAHFELIASTLANHAATVRGSPIAHNALVDNFADKLGQTNPAFNRDIFRKAAGYK